MVEISAAPTFTTSFDSGLRWCSGNRDRRNIPTSAPPNTQPNTIKLIARELISGATSAAKPRNPDFRSLQDFGRLSQGSQPSIDFGPPGGRVLVIAHSHRDPANHRGEGCSPE